MKSLFDDQRGGKPPQLQVLFCKYTPFISNHQIFNIMEFHAEIEKEEKKAGWGGAREGAGRKRKGVHYYGFRATQEVHDILSQVEGSKADFINDCILKACSGQ